MDWFILWGLGSIMSIIPWRNIIKREVGLTIQILGLIVLAICMVLIFVP